MIRNLFWLLGIVRIALILWIGYTGLSNNTSRFKDPISAPEQCRARLVASNANR